MFDVEKHQTGKMWTDRKGKTYVSITNPITQKQNTYVFDYDGNCIKRYEDIGDNFTSIRTMNVEASDRARELYEEYTE